MGSPIKRQTRVRGTLQHAERLAREEIAHITRLFRKQKKIREAVRELLERHEEARNSDGYLQWLYARQYLGLKKLPYLNFRILRGLNFDSIARARRFWQNDRGKFLPTEPRVAAARRAKSEAMKKAYS